MRTDTPILVIPPRAAALADFAHSLGLGFRPDPPAPGELDPATPVVLVDPGRNPCEARAHPDLSAWCGRRGRLILVSGAADAPSTGEGPPWPFFLTPRECLRHLALGADPAAHYARHPADYVADTGEGPRDLERRLLPVLGTTADWRATWQSAVATLAEPGRLRDLGDLTLGLVPAAIPPGLALEAARCVLRARHPWLDADAGQSLPRHPLLLVRHTGESVPDAAVSDADPRQAVAGLTLFANDPEFAKGLPGWKLLTAAPSHYACGWEYVVRHFETDPTAAPRALDRDLSRLFGRLLVDHRPLRHYGCTFFFPFDPGLAHRESFRKALKQKAEPAPDEKTTADGPQVRRHRYGDRAVQTQTDGQETKNARQAMLYFFPHLREQLFDLGADDPVSDHGGADAAQRTDPCEPVQEWRSVAAQGWRLELVPGTDSEGGPAPRPLSAPVQSLRLFGYYNGTYLLALRVELPPPAGPWAALGQDTPEWWHPLVFGPADSSDLAERALSRWLQFTRLALVIYPSFTEQWQEGKLPAQVRLLKNPSQVQWTPQPRLTDAVPLPWPPGENLSQVLRDLLGHFFGADPIGDGSGLDALLNRYADFHDDRLFVNVAYGLAGPVPEPAVRRAVLGRLFSLALFVDRPVDTFDDCGGLAYDRDWLKGALAESGLRIWEETGLYAGFTGFSNAWLGCGDFFCETAAPRHVPYSYERMLILALFYQLALRGFSRAVSHATAKLTGSARDDGFKDLRREFITFTNTYWFHEVTAQLQGREVFRLQQEALGLEREYQFIKDELERADEFLTAQRQERFSRLSSVVAAVGLFFACMAVLSAILPVVPQDGEVGPLGAALMSGEVWGRAAVLLGLVALPSFIVGLLGFLAARFWPRGRAARPSARARRTPKAAP